MVKSDKLDSNKQSSIAPFHYIPEVFPDDVATQNIETTENGSKLKSKMKLLDEDEVPEQFMIWLKDLEDKVLKNEVLKAPGRLVILRRLVNFEAQTILSNVENDYKNIYKEPEDVTLLTDYRIRDEILAKYTTDQEVKIYFGDGGAADVKKLRVEHIIKEAIHRINY